MPENPNKTSTLLEQQFRALESNPAWAEYRANLQDRYEQAVAAAMTKTTAPEAELRVAVALASAFRTALALPQAIIGAARMQEDIDQMENEDDA